MAAWWRPGSVRLTSADEAEASSGLAGAGTSASLFRGSQLEILATLRATLWHRVGWPVSILIVFALCAAIAWGGGEQRLAWVLAGIGAAWSAAATLRAWVQKVVIRRNGVRVRSLGGVAEVLFDEVTEWTYDARSYRLYLFVPLGRTGRLSLSNGDDTVTFDSTCARFHNYLPVVTELTTRATVQRMRARIDAGGTASFGGRLEMDHRELRLRRWFRSPMCVPLTEVYVEIGDGLCRLSTGGKLLGEWSLGHTPNLLVLPILLDELLALRGHPRPALLHDALVWDGRPINPMGA